MEWHTSKAHSVRTGCFWKAYLHAPRHASTHTHGLQAQSYFAGLEEVKCWRTLVNELLPAARLNSVSQFFCPGSGSQLGREVLPCPLLPCHSPAGQAGRGWPALASPMGDTAREGASNALGVMLASGRGERQLERAHAPGQNLLGRDLIKGLYSQKLRKPGIIPSRAIPTFPSALLADDDLHA